MYQCLVYLVTGLIYLLSQMCYKIEISAIEEIPLGLLHRGRLLERDRKRHAEMADLGTESIWQRLSWTDVGLCITLHYLRETMIEFFYACVVWIWFILFSWMFFYIHCFLFVCCNSVMKLAKPRQAGNILRTFSQRYQNILAATLKTL